MLNFSPKLGNTFQSEILAHEIVLVWEDIESTVCPKPKIHPKLNTRAHHIVQVWEDILYYYVITIFIT